MRATAFGIVLTIAVAGCTGSSETSAPTSAPATTAAETVQETSPTSAAPETTAPGETTAPAESTTIAPTTVTPDPGTLRLAPASAAQPFALRFGIDGVWVAAHTGVYSQVVEGPVTEAADTYLGGVVYQRPGIDNKIFVLGDDGADRELLVGTDEQTLTLIGSRVDGGDDAEVLYLRKTNSGFATDSETLRSYNMGTGEVTEIAEVGGWESATDYSFADADRIVGRWGAEAFSGLNILNTVTGEIEFGSEDECFYGDYSDSCPVYTDAVLHDGLIYGFGPIVESDGSFSRMGLHRYDLQTETQELLSSWPYDPASPYESNGMLPGDPLIISLVDAQGEPLPALIFDLTTNVATTAPIAGNLRPAYLS